MFSNNLTTQRQAPYWDDYLENIESRDKNYIKILFRPGRSVQARELTQMQTMLQSQINKFGKSIFVEGTAVINGLCTIDNNVTGLKLNTSSPNSDLVTTEIKVKQLLAESGTIYDGSTTVLRAKVIGYAIIDTQFYLYIKYLNSGIASTGSEVKFFQADGVITGKNSSNVVVSTFKLNASAATCLASRISVDRGIYFVAGAFVENVPQSIFVNYTITAGQSDLSGYAVFDVVESVVTYSEDTSLLDNSTGYNNYSAPGADRHKIDLRLGFKTISEWDSLSTGIHKFLKVLAITNGKIFIAQKTEYSKLTDILAQRTYEESGNYTVRSFQIDLRDYSTTLDPRGLNSDSETNALAAARAKFVIGVEPAVAYVDGYRVQLNERKDLIVSKPRQTSDLLYNAAATFTAKVGNYVIGKLVSTVAGAWVLPDISALHNSAIYTTYNLLNSSGTTVGTCTINSIETNSSDSATAANNTYRVFINNIVFASTYIFSNIASIALSTYLKLTPTSGSVFNLYDSDLGSLVFPLPYKSVKTLYNTAATPALALTYTIRLRLSGTVGSVLNKVSIATTAGTFNSNVAADYVAVNATTGVVLTVIDVAVGTPATTVTLTFSPQAANTNSIHVITHVFRTPTDFRRKTLSTGIAGWGFASTVETSSQPTVLTASPIFTAKLILNHADIVKITKVTFQNPAQASPLTAVAIGTQNEQDLSPYILDNGQRDSEYIKGSVYHNSSPYGIPPGTIIHYTYYAHDTNVNSDFFSVDSYSDYDQIPSYRDNSLSDCLDFRRIAPSVINNTTAIIQIEPNSVITTSIQAYMPRVDLLVVNKDSEFIVVSGQASLYPVAPEIPLHTMALYQFDMPAYTKFANSIQISHIDNQRYTMRDIGSLESRISSLEHFTSLSLLETDTIRKSIVNLTTGAERFKNGFFVDGFNGSNLANPSHPGYACAIDHNNQILRPMAIATNSRLLRESATNANITVVNDLMTLTPSSVILITQLNASSKVFVNPYNIFTWTGSIELSPSSDDWMDTVRRADVVTDNQNLYAAVVAKATADGSLGTVWNFWETNWASASRVVARNPNGTSQDNNAWTSTETASTKTRTGITTSIQSSTTVVRGADTIISTAIVPFIRSKLVYFKATLLKPNTRVYPFFDNVAIGAYTKLDNGTNSTVALSFAKNFKSSGGSTNDNTSLYTNVTLHPTGALNSDLLTDQYGTVTGSFIIPNISTLHFKTGDRTFKLSDSLANDDTVATTIATGVYSASGVLQTVAGQVTSTRIANIIRTNVTDTSKSSETRITYFDPLAQSFMIGNIPTGCFITKIDLFFASKDTTIPVSVHIVDCQNGTPTQNIVPGSKVIVAASSVNADNTAATATVVTFELPLYLKSGVEYAIIITSMSDAYSVWIAELGAKNISGGMISKNPYIGVFFTSQNASTWTADQTKDLKFNMYRAEYTTTASATVTFKTKDDDTTPNAAATLINLLTQELVFPDTSITWSGAFNTAPTAGFAIASNKNYQLPVRREFNAGKWITFTAILSTKSKYLTPAIDLERLSLIKIDNLINNVTSIYDIVGGVGVNAATAVSAVASCKYVTPEIILHYPAEQLDIYMDISLPKYTSVTVYAKQKTASALLIDTAWASVSQLSGTVIPVTDDQSEFNSAQFTIPETNPPTPFSSFMIKIELTGDNALTALTPLIKNLRIIATT